MDKTKNPSRNPWIELCRFTAAAVLMLHHTEKLGGERIAWGGWIFVEYFFILSGYFMTRHFEKTEVKATDLPGTALRYTLKKLLRILPFAAAGIGIDLIESFASGEIPLADLHKVIFELPGHLLLLKGLPILSYDLNAPLWYLTAILLATPCLTLLQLRFRSFYKHLACWVLPLLIYSVMHHFNGTVQYWGEFWSLNCMMRGFAGMMTGSLLYYLSEWLKAKQITGDMRRFMTALEILCFALLVFLTVTDNCMTYFVWCMTLIMTSLCITFSGQELICARMPGWINYLGKLSLPVYCLHRPIYDTVCQLCSGVPFEIRLWIGIGGTLAVSVLLLLAVEKIKGIRRKKTSL